MGQRGISKVNGWLVAGATGLAVAAVLVAVGEVAVAVWVAFFSAAAVVRGDGDLVADRARDGMTASYLYAALFLGVTSTALAVWGLVLLFGVIMPRSGSHVALGAMSIIGSAVGFYASYASSRHARQGS
jgi:hypothetical protein